MDPLSGVLFSGARFTGAPGRAAAGRDSHVAASHRAHAGCSADTHQQPTANVAAHCWGMYDSPQLDPPPACVDMKGSSM